MEHSTLQQRDHTKISKPAGHVGAASKPLVTVTDQTRIPDMSDPTGDSDVWRVQFTTASGIASWLFVPESAYETDMVARLVHDKAVQIEGVSHIHERTENRPK